MPDKPVWVAQHLPGYEPEIGAALWGLQDARERTLRVLKDLPDDVLNQETEGNGIGTTLYHVALIEADWLYTEILEQTPPDEITALLPQTDRDDERVLTSIRGETLEEHLARLSAIRETLLRSLTGMTTEDFHRTRSLPNYNVSPAWVLQHLAQHDAEHRSEMDAVISRLGGKPRDLG